MGRKSNSIISKLASNTAKTNATSSEIFSSNRNPSSFRQTLITNFLVKKPLVEVSISPQISPFTTPIPIWPSTGKPFYTMRTPCRENSVPVPSSTAIALQGAREQNHSALVPKVYQALSSLAYSSDSHSDIGSSKTDPNSINWPVSVTPLLSPPS